MCNRLLCLIDEKKLVEELNMIFARLDELNKKVDEIIKDHELKQEGGM